jgi:hypothetical protein
VLGLFSKNKRKKEILAMAQRLDGRHIRYVGEKKDGIEEIVGKDGCLALSGDEFLVSASGQTILRCKLAELDIWELLSKEGTVITAPDIEHGGEVRTVVAYYVYYR